jgi:hypothetical protein
MTKYDLFISYSRKDMAIVDELCKACDAAGVRYYVNREGRDDDASFPEEWIATIRQCGKMLFVASANAYRSKLAIMEIYHGFSNLQASNIFLYRVDSHDVPENIGNLFGAENCRDLVTTPISAALVCDICGIEPPVVAPEPKPEPKPAPAPAPEPEPKPAPAPAPEPKAQISVENSATTRQSSLRPSSVDRSPSLKPKKGVIAAIIVSAILLVLSIGALIVVVGGDSASDESGDVLRVYTEAERAEAIEEASMKSTYQIGDLYCKGGKMGVVFEVSYDGQHGKILSLDCTQLQWATAQQYMMGYKVGAVSSDDGMYNTNVVMARRDCANYPAVWWCRSKGDEWYLPAIGELEVFTLNPYVRRAVNETLYRFSARQIHEFGEQAWYWSSTEWAQNPRAYAMLVRTHDAQTNFGYKYAERPQGNPYVRAVAVF